jgi:hypothetical protein
MVTSHMRLRRFVFLGKFQILASEIRVTELVSYAHPQEMSILRSFTLMVLSRICEEPPLLAR